MLCLASSDSKLARGTQRKMAAISAEASFLSLDEAVKAEVLVFLPGEDVSMCRVLSSAWRKSASDEVLWKRILSRLLGGNTGAAAEQADLMPPIGICTTYFDAWKGWRAIKSRLDVDGAQPVSLPLYARAHRLVEDLAVQGQGLGLQPPLIPSTATEHDLGIFKQLPPCLTAFLHVANGQEDVQEDNMWEGLVGGYSYYDTAVCTR